MREDDEEVKHVCRFCAKSFPSGRQLGGHMRSHQNHNSNSVDAAGDGNKKRRRERGRHDEGENSDGGVGLGSGGSSKTAYVLREDPRKTWRIAGELTEDTWLDWDKSCRECGRGFGSWKALFVHMKRHAPEDRDSRTGDEQGAVVIEGQEGRGWNDEDEEDVVVPNRRRRSERRKRYMVVAASSSSMSLVNNINNNLNDDSNHHAGSSVSEIDQEQEEVAMCLMMLSRDAGHRKATDSIIPKSSEVKRPSSDAENGRGVMGNPSLDNFEVEDEVRFQSKVDFPDFGSAKDSNSQQGSQMDGTKAKITENISRVGSLSSDLNDSDLGMKTRKEFAVDEDGFRLLSGENSDKRNRFECTTCNNVFHSYQALGGHKASHGKLKDCSNGNTIGETEIFPPRKKSQKRVDGFSGKKHVCPVCLKVFRSGQALGGHKRSHLQPTNGPAEDAPMLKPATSTRDAFDLNLPAQIEDEGSSQLTFSSWHSLSPP